MNIPIILQATGFKKYTPSSGTTPYNFCTMYLTDDCTMNVTDHFDNAEDAVPFKAGYHPMLFKRIRSISAGSVYLCHNGKQPTFQEVLNTQGF
jgi:hypothetical protein